MIFIACLTATLSHTMQSMTLIEAIAQKKYKTARQLIRDGADVNCRTVMENTPLHYAASRGLIRITRLLLEHGANVNASDRYGSTALIQAAGHFKTMKLLLDHGANAPFPLFLTISKGQLKCTKLLMQYGADPMNIRNLACHTTALHIAAYSERKHIVKYFLEYGIPVNVKDEAGRTPLGNILDNDNAFFSSNRILCIRLLLDHGADAAKYVHIPYHSKQKLYNFIGIWAYARAQGKESEFIRLNEDTCSDLLSNDNMMNQLEQDTRTARLRMLCIKHGVRNTQDLLFKRETGMIRLP